HRLYVPSERISVVVLFNHLSDTRSAAIDVLAAALGEARPKPDDKIPAPKWLGSYVEPETGLAVRIEPAPARRIKLRFGHSAEELDLEPDGSAKHSSGTRLRFGDGGLWMDRPQENQNSRLGPCGGASGTDAAGRYRSRELDAELAIADVGGVLYGAFS